jgi:hypothetical protein
MKVDRIVKIIASICIVLFIIALVVVWNSPATGYELCIYSATPLIFWVALILSFGCGVSIVVQQIYTGEHRKGSLWVIGLILILLSYIALQSLWIIKGYPFWGSGDPITHLGWIQNVICGGHIERWNYYSILHIYLSSISLISGIAPMMSSKYIPLLFSLLFVLFMYVVAKAILPHRGQIILAIVASTALVNIWYLNLTPMLLSKFTLPLAFFLLIRTFTSGAYQWRALFIVMIFLFPLFHIVSAFILLLVLLSLWLPGRALRILRNDSSAIKTTFGFNITASFLLFIWAIVWVSSVGLWDDPIRRVYTLITEGGQADHIWLMSAAQQLAEYGPSVIAQVFRLYGTFLMYGVLTLTAFAILWKKASTDVRAGNLLSLYGPLVAFALAVVCLLFLNLGFGPFRLLIYMAMICVFFTGFTLHWILEKARTSHYYSYRRMIAPVLVIAILTAASMNSALIVYPTQYTLGTTWQNTQITRTQIAGMDWFLHKSASMPITGLAIPPGRFAVFLLPPEERRERGHMLPAELPKELIVPSRFGYDKNTFLGELYAKDTYLIFDEKDKAFQEVYPKAPQFEFLATDFKKLERDPSVDKLYSNSGLVVYKIRARVLSP